MQYAAGKSNFYALYAAIMNHNLTCNKALAYFGVKLTEGAEEQGIARRRTPKAKLLDINLVMHNIRRDYEKGMSIVELKYKYNRTNTTITNAIRAAGGTVRKCVRNKKVEV